MRLKDKIAVHGISDLRDGSFSFFTGKFDAYLIELHLNTLFLF
jgi:hypothetical protein